MSKVAPRSKPEFCGVSISMSRVKLSEAMGRIRPGAYKGAKGNGFGGNARKDIKWVSRDYVGEVRDHCDAVPSIGSLVAGGVNGRGRMRKSRGRVRT